MKYSPIYQQSGQKNIKQVDHKKYGYKYNFLCLFMEQCVCVCGGGVSISVWVIIRFIFCPQMGSDSIIGALCQIAEKTSIKRSTIGNSTTIKEKVKVTNSIIMPGVTIEEGWEHTHLYTHVLTCWEHLLLKCFHEHINLIKTNSPSMHVYELKFEVCWYMHAVCGKAVISKVCHLYHSSLIFMLPEKTPVHIFLHNLM